MISFVHINFLLILLIFPFPSFYYHVLLFCKHHLIIPKQYSDWLISIKVGQSFWSKISLTVVTIKVSSKTLSKFSLTKKTLIATKGLYVKKKVYISSKGNLLKITLTFFGIPCNCFWEGVWQLCILELWKWNMLE